MGNLRSKVTFNIVIASAGATLDALCSGEADLGLAFYLQERAEVEVTAHCQLWHRVLVSAEHPFAQCPSIRLEDLQGQPLAEQRSELARNLMWIGHAAGIKGLLTAEENLAWLCALHRPASREAVWQALEAVGLRGFEDVPCHTLSAGQQRRVALARLHLACPPLWILDEPFTALDVRGVANLAQRIGDHLGRGGVVVLTTHQDVPVPGRVRKLDLGAPPCGLEPLPDDGAAGAGEGGA